MSTLQYIGLLVAILIIGGVLYGRQTPTAPAPETAAPETAETAEKIGPMTEKVTEKIKDVLPSIPSATGVTIYDGITVPANSTEVDLSGRGLSGSLKAEIRLVSNVETLYLSGNNFTGLPAEVGQLSKLRVLDLRNNPLTGLPHELGNLKNLTRLDLRGTNYSQTDLEIIAAALPATTEILK